MTVYHPHIDGLRALAVLPVVLFHAGVPYFGGGFIGVDVFFVISGFLITSIIDEKLRIGKFHIIDFYERRIRRILPALLLVIAFCLAMGYLSLPPTKLEILSQSSIAALAFVSNMFFWMQPGGYFADAHSTSPLLHTWSLAIEEQFYLAYPLMLVVMVRIPAFRRHVMWGLMGLSLVVSIWGTYQKPSATFFMLPFRLWELMVGGVLAIELPQAVIVARTMPKLLLPVFGLIGIVAPAFLYDSSTLFPGAAALVPCLGAAALILSGYVSRGLVVRVLEWRGLVAVGLISYPLYLWHWPLLTFSKSLQFGRLDNRTATAVVAISASFIFAWLTWLLLEKPVRNRRWFATTRSLFTGVSIAIGAVFILASAGVVSDGFPSRVPPQSQRVAQLNEAISSEWDFPCDNFNKPIHLIKLCRFGPLGPPSTRVLFWGDSHVEQIYSATKHIISGLPDPGMGVIFATSGGCLPLMELERNTRNFKCEEFNKYIFELAKSSEVDSVVLSGFWTDFFPDQNHASRSYNFVKTKNGVKRQFSDKHEIIDFVKEQLIKQVRALRSAGKRVLVVLPYPTFNISPPEYLWRQLLVGRDAQSLLTLKMHQDQKGEFGAIVRNAVVEAGGEAIDPAPFLCQNECRYKVGGVSLYRDNNHLVPRGVATIRPMLDEIISRAAR